MSGKRTLETLNTFVPLAHIAQIPLVPETLEVMTAKRSRASPWDENATVEGSSISHPTEHPTGTGQHVCARATTPQIEHNRYQLCLALDSVQKVAKWGATEKHAELAWLGKRPVHSILFSADHPSRPADYNRVIEICQKYPTESKLIAEGGFRGSWEEGFHAGACAFAKMVQTLAQTELDAETHVRVEREHGTRNAMPIISQMLAIEREQAWRDHPDMK